MTSQYHGIGIGTSKEHLEEFMKRERKRKKKA
jgi:hypothetical protein